ncbi:MAG: hypothetical protein H8E45_06435 [Proteobacteria bacterium]|nr:hypothetical protein [Pseudomonadota bacterium]
MFGKMLPSALLGGLLLTLALLYAAGLACAGGTRVVASLVPVVTTLSGGTGHPTMEPGRVILKSGGASKVKLQGVTNAHGSPVTTDNSLQLVDEMSGDEYIVVVSGSFPATSTVYEFNIPVELRNGKGKASADRSPQYWLIPDMAHRAAEFHLIDVYEPPAPEDAPNCRSVVDAGGTVIDGAPNPCRSGRRLASVGLLIP